MCECACVCVDNQACGSCFKRVYKQQFVPCGYWKLFKLRGESLIGDYNSSKLHNNADPCKYQEDNIFSGTV